MASGSFSKQLTDINGNSLSWMRLEGTWSAIAGSSADNKSSLTVVFKVYRQYYVSIGTASPGIPTTFKYATNANGPWTTMSVNAPSVVGTGTTTLATFNVTIPHASDGTVTLYARLGWELRSDVTISGKTYRKQFVPSEGGYMTWVFDTIPRYPSISTPTISWTGSSPKTSLRGSWTGSVSGGSALSYQYAFSYKEPGGSWTELATQTTSNSYADLSASDRKVGTQFRVKARSYANGLYSAYATSLASSGRENRIPTFAVGEIGISNHGLSVSGQSSFSVSWPVASDPDNEWPANRYSVKVRKITGNIVVGTKIQNSNSATFTFPKGTLVAGDKFKVEVTATDAHLGSAYKETGTLERPFFAFVYKGGQWVPVSDVRGYHKSGATLVWGKVNSIKVMSSGSFRGLS